jgi:hypothetical protein
VAAAETEDAAGVDDADGTSIAGDDEAAEAAGAATGVEGRADGANAIDIADEGKEASIGNSVDAEAAVVPAAATAAAVFATSSSASSSIIDIESA